MVDVPSPIIAGIAATFPNNASNENIGPVTLYQLSQGEIAMPETVTFEVTTPSVWIWSMQFTLKYIDPSGNVIWASPTPYWDFE